MTMILRTVFLLCLSLSAMAATDLYQFETPVQEQRFRVLLDELRCPKCQNQSLADSDAGIAQDMRVRVESMIKEGKSDEEIVDYFVSRYGDFVSYRPPVTPTTSILWLAPLLLLGSGAVVIVLLLRRASARVDDNDAADESDVNQGETGNDVDCDCAGSATGPGCLVMAVVAARSPQGGQGDAGCHWHSPDHAGASRRRVWSGWLQ
ncbi:cytochrome c-type biogenesis protein [Alcanivorax sp. IL1]|uniref:cytochrome c-type biogenesis protein n=1 Tax=Alcanivorax sp. IL1 TaxID=3396308 RepID=UPI0039C0B068